MKSVPPQNRSIRHINNGAKNQGFSMIEILISVVVLSIGLMGLGGLQIAALKGTNHAHYSTEASLLIMDLADRMRTNIVGVADGDYITNTDINCASSPAKQCNSVSCDSAELASYDKHIYSCRASKKLPSGTLTINCKDDNCEASIEDADKEQRLNKTHTLTVTWHEAKKKNEVISNNKKYKLKSITLDIVP